MTPTGVLGVTAVLAASFPVVRALGALGGAQGSPGPTRALMRRLLVRASLWEAAVSFALATTGSGQWWVPLAGSLPVLAAAWTTTALPDSTGNGPGSPPSR